MNRYSTFIGALSARIPRVIRTPPTQQPRKVSCGRGEGRRHQRNHACLVPWVPVVSEMQQDQKRSANFPHSQDCLGKTMVFVFTADLHPCLLNGISARRLLKQNQREGRTLMTSNGCVASVAKVPEAAAEPLCNAAEARGDDGGSTEAASCLMAS
jgi:hypothetical protein